MKNKISLLFFLVLLISSCIMKSQEKDLGEPLKPKKPIEPEVIEVNKGNYWMKSWLNVTRFKNGDSILYCQDERSWTKACENQIPAFCTSADKSTKYYNMSCVTDNRGIAPEGFKLPTSSEVEDLFISHFIYRPLSPIFRKFDDPTWQSLTEIRTKTKFEIFPSGARLSSNYFDEIQNQTAYLWTRTTLKFDGKKGSSYVFFTVNVKDVYEGWTKDNTWQSWNQGFPILCLKGNSHDKAGKVIIEEMKMDTTATVIYHSH